MNTVERTYWTSSRIDKPYDPEAVEVCEQVDEDKATLVSSITTRGTHAPVIDIDLPCSLVPSTTPDHFHLYIDHHMEWEAYVTLLRALVAAGIVENGYAEASIRRGQTMVRKPGVRKPAPPSDEILRGEGYLL